MELFKRLLVSLGFLAGGLMIARLGYEIIEQAVLVIDVVVFEWMTVIFGAFIVLGGLLLFATGFFIHLED